MLLPGLPSPCLLSKRRKNKLKKTQFAIILLLLCALTFGCLFLTKSRGKEAYRDKIWIPEGFPGECSFSFHINQINGNFVAGNLHIGETALPDLYVYRKEPSRWLLPFSGEIKGDVARCRFTEPSNRAGTLTIQFCDRDSVNASIDFGDTDILREYGLPAAYQSFRPYNLSDLELVPGKEIVQEITLNHWGHVFVRAESGNRAPAVLITDSNGNILYNIWATITGTEITKLVLEDINGDSLTDIRFFMQPFNAVSAETGVWAEYYQLDSGLFCNAGLLRDRSG